MNQVKEALEAALLPLGTLVVERVTLERYHSPGMQQAVRDAHDKVLAALAALPDVERLATANNAGHEALSTLIGIARLRGINCDRYAVALETMRAAAEATGTCEVTAEMFATLSPAEPAARKFSVLRDQPVLSATKTADGFRVAAPSGEVIFIGVVGGAPDGRAHRHTVSADDNFGDVARCTTDPKCVLPAGHDAEPAAPSGECACGTVHPVGRCTGWKAPPPEAAAPPSDPETFNFWFCRCSGGSGVAYPAQFQSVSVNGRVHSPSECWPNATNGSTQAHPDGGLLRSAEELAKMWMAASGEAWEVRKVLAARDAELAKIREQLRVVTVDRDRLQGQWERSAKAADHYSAKLEEEKQAHDRHLQDAINQLNETQAKLEEAERLRDLHLDMAEKNADMANEAADRADAAEKERHTAQQQTHFLRRDLDLLCAELAEVNVPKADVGQPVATLPIEKIIWLRKSLKIAEQRIAEAVEKAARMVEDADDGVPLQCLADAIREQCLTADPKEGA